MNALYECQQDGCRTAGGLLLASTSMQLTMQLMLTHVVCVRVVQEPPNLANVGIRVVIGGDGACE